MKTRRHEVLLELLNAGEVTSQAQAVTLLRARGFDVTQSTVSRDLDELGAVRVRGVDGSRYGIIDRSPSYGGALAHVLRDYVLRKSASGPLAVLHTPPGHASVVAAALDRAQPEGILGTVAGDDTLFVCGDDNTQGRGVISLLERLEQAG